MSGDGMSPPLVERRAPRWLKVANRLNVLLLRRGIGPAPQHLLAVQGRRTGTLRTSPVAVLAIDGRRYVVAGYAGSDWVKNARAAGWANLIRGRDTQRVILAEVPLEQRSPILCEFVRQVPGGRSFLTVGRNAPAEELVRACEHHPVFLLQTDQKAA